MSSCYIIYSKELDKYYIGFTQDSVENRLMKHNSAAYGQKFTSQTSDWELFYSIQCENIAQAMGIEKHIKRMKSRKYIENLKVYPEITEKLLRTFKST